jgi:hypothetical protein
MDSNSGTIMLQAGIHCSLADLPAQSKLVIMSVYEYISNLEAICELNDYHQMRNCISLQTAP